MKRLYQAGAILLAALREIFDESAYQRFLQQTSQTPSRASYREFLRRPSKPRPRCC